MNKTKKATLKTRQRLDLIFGLVAAKTKCQDETQKEAFNGVIKEELEAIGLYYDYENMPLATQMEHKKEFNRLIYNVDQFAKDLRDIGVE